MPSPFPGMDPYIESSGYFPEFHGSMVVAIRDDLNARLPRGFAATMDLHVWVQRPGLGEGERVREPDVYVTERSRGKKGSAAAVAFADPETILLRAAKKRRKYVKIEDLASHRIVTVLEVLSPSNKEAGRDRASYLLKRGEYLASDVSFVEIDLLRGGRRLPLGDPPKEVRDYYVMVCRAWRFPEAGFYGFDLRAPLPEVPVPVTRDVPEVRLPLRACADRVYDGARYAEKLDYDRLLSPRVRKRDVVWIQDVLAARRQG